jgi:hypothetical protein
MEPVCAIAANASDIYALHKKRQQKFFALHNKSIQPDLTFWQGPNFSLAPAM